MAVDTDIAVIGAGPYGLSLGAFLAERGADFAVFGVPMAVWQTHMPPGMMLKSEGFASTLFDPRRTLSLAQYCAEVGEPYRDVGLPVPRDRFHRYGLAFQRRFLPGLDPTLVQRLEADGTGFVLLLEDGRRVRARRVVVAAGISHFAHLPAELAALPAELCRHTSTAGPVAGYAGRRTVVLGGGSSAVDMAGLLHAAGAAVQVVTRRDRIWFNSPPAELTGLGLLAARLRRPRSGIGLGWRSRLASDLPALFHHMPEHLRIRVTRGHLGPSVAWFSREQVEGRVPLRHGLTLRRATEAGGSVLLSFSRAGGGTETVLADQVVAGTGYRVDVKRLPFLAAALRARIATVQDTPILSRRFESTVPGLFFVGPAAANSFGPVLRFAWGARFAAPTLAAHLAPAGRWRGDKRPAARRPAPDVAAPPP